MEAQHKKAQKCFHARILRIIFLLCCLLCSELLENPHNDGFSTAEG